MTRDEILFILLIIVMIISVYKLLKPIKLIKQSRTELMTLKLFCDERDRSCSVACTKSNGVFDKRCFIDCQVNSQIC